MAISRAYRTNRDDLVSQWALALLRDSPTACTAMLDSCEMMHRYKKDSWERDFWLDVHDKTITYSGVRPRSQWELMEVEVQETKNGKY